MEDKENMENSFIDKMTMGKGPTNSILWHLNMRQGVK